MIHRALIGSLERFIGILIEHFGGAFPFWLAPVQLRVHPGRRVRIASRHARWRRSSRPYRVEVDESDETVGKKIRNAEVEKIPFVIVYGDKESRRVARGARARRRAIDAFAGGASRDSLATLTP